MPIEKSQRRYRLICTSSTHTSHCDKYYIGMFTEDQWKAIQMLESMFSPFKIGRPPKINPEKSVRLYSISSNRHL